MDTFTEEGERLLSTAKTRGTAKYDDREKTKMVGFQSLDFTVSDNQILHEYHRRNTKWDYFVDMGGKWMLCFWIGLLLGFIAFGVKIAVEALNEIKFHYSEKLLEHHPFLSFLFYSGSGLTFALAASLIIIIVRQPLAGGSGIPEVKGYLNGIRIPNSLNVRTLFGKTISIILSFSSGLVLGPEGPMIHIGSMIGAAVGQVKSKSLKWYPKMFWRYHNDRDRRDFISCGAAAGVAAAFGAPIGGTLFSIEEASSFWSNQLTWRTFFTCLVAVMTISTLQNGGNQKVQDHGILFFGLSQDYLYRLPEIFSFIMLGIFGGLVGAVFVYLNVALNHWRSHKLKNVVIRVFEVILVSLVTSALCFTVSYFMPCRDMTNITYSTLTDGCTNSTKPIKFVTMRCPEGQYSDVGSLLFNTPENALQILYNRSENVLSFQALAISFFAFFIFGCLTSGLFLAGGLFIPMMLMGATSGRFFGKVLLHIFHRVQPPLDPSVYALVGTAAVMGGISRLTIALVVIIVELTEGTQYLLPIILAVMVSKWVGDVFTEAHYEHLMETKHIPFLEPNPPQSMLLLSVAEIMHSPVEALQMIEKVSDLVDKLQYCNYGAFPIVEAGPQGNSRIFKGSILRSQILVMMKKKLFGTLVSSGNYDNDNGNNRQISVVARLTHEEFTGELARKIPSIEDIRLSNAELNMYMDFRPYANMSSTTVHETWSYTEAYRLFRTMGLRHLFVVDKKNEVVGVITRKDLL